MQTRSDQEAPNVENPMRKQKREGSGTRPRDSAGAQTRIRAELAAAGVEGACEDRREGQPRRACEAKLRLGGEETRRSWHGAGARRPATASLRGEAATGRRGDQEVMARRRSATASHGELARRSCDWAARRPGGHGTAQERDEWHRSVWHEVSTRWMDMRTAR